MFYSMGIVAGDNDYVVRIRLVRLYLKKRQWAKVGQEVWAAFKMITRDVWEAGQRSWHHLR
jgi:hypothetical protein